MMGGEGKDPHQREVSGGTPPLLIVIMQAVGEGKSLLAIETALQMLKDAREAIAHLDPAMVEINLLKLPYLKGQVRVTVEPAPQDSSDFSRYNASPIPALDWIIEQLEAKKTALPDPETQEIFSHPSR